MAISTMHPRIVERRLREAHDDSPAVLLHGPRQSGKTTLARHVGDDLGYGYYSLDDDSMRESAVTDPMGFVAELPDRVILDEAQRAPGLFTALKASIDNRRTPGRFLLTGSANVLLLPTLADSLAGRMDVIRLLPLAQSEIERTTPWFLDALVTGSFGRRDARRLGQELAEIIVRGGYPAALARPTPHRRTAWYRNYVESLVQRDVQDIAQISRLDLLSSLLEAVAGQTARLLNITDLAGPFEISRPTVREYSSLLQKMFLVDTQPAWHTNRLSRLIKTAKLHIGDTGVGAALLQVDAPTLYEDRRLLGQMLETFIFQELRKQALARTGETVFHHFRNKDQVEVDIVLRLDGRRIGAIEIKAASTVTDADFRGLRKVRDAEGDSFTAGVVLYDGEHVLPFGDRLHAVPVSTLWS